MHLVNPLVPYLNYAINKNYIAKNLCVKKDIPNNTCNGKCHLKKQIKQNQDNNNPENTNLPNINLKKNWNEFLLGFSKLPELPETQIKHQFINKLANTTTFIPPVFIPPKQAFT